MKIKKIIFFLFCSIILCQENNHKIKLEAIQGSNQAWWFNHNNSGLNTDYAMYIYNANKKNFEIQMSTFFSDKLVDFQESFLKYNINSRSFLRLGKYYRDFSNYLDDSLSSGHMLLSKNSRPLPKIGIKTNLPINKKFKINAGLSHSLLEKDDFYIKRPQLHEKFFGIEYELNKNSILNISLIHEAIFGGTTVDDGSQPVGFLNFVRVFFALDQKKTDLRNGIPQTHINAIGNHIGIWDFSLTNIYKTRKIIFYYQHIFEDTSGIRFDNKTDGLWGINIKNQLNGSSFLMEILITSNQDRDPPYVDESYYNHGIYKKGWSYKNQGLGNPFLTYGIHNENKINVFHVGFQKKIYETLSLKIKTSKILSGNDFKRFEVQIINKRPNLLTWSISLANNGDKIDSKINLTKELSKPFY